MEGQTKPNQKSYQLACYSKEIFIKKYADCHHDKEKLQGIYYELFTQFKRTLTEGDISEFRKIIDFMGVINKIDNNPCFVENSFHTSNIIILACQYNEVIFLECILEHLNIVSKFFGENSLSPGYVDYGCCNAFYYAVRSNNVDLLETLINKWPKDYFQTHQDELEELLAKALHELRLKNVLLRDEMKIFVEDKLVKLRFYSDNRGGCKNNSTSLENIIERITLIIENINLLHKLENRIDEKFLFIAKFIAKNIFILKRILKSTYDILPWEEVEFCLISFIHSQSKKQELNLFYCAVLSRKNILSYLKTFSNKLGQLIVAIRNVDIKKLRKISTVARNKIVTKIIQTDLQFEDLYKNYMLIRDVTSLQIIDKYANIVTSVNSNEKEGQIVIIRTLQIIGEHLKNSLESPKLSETTSDLLLLSLSKNINRILKDLRNSLSHGTSMNIRIDTDDFFTNMQNDCKKIRNVINNILLNYKIKAVRMILEKIASSENCDELQTIMETLQMVEFDTFLLNCPSMEQEKIETMINKLENLVESSYQSSLLKKIKELVQDKKISGEKSSLQICLAVLVQLGKASKYMKIDCIILKGSKFRARKVLENLPKEIDYLDLEKITDLLAALIRETSLCMKDDKQDEFMRLCYKIYHIVQFELNHVHYLSDFKDKLINKIEIDEKLNNHNKSNTKKVLTLKLTEIEEILHKHSLITLSCEAFLSFKSNNHLQIVLEMLLLDIMSILDDENYLEDNLYFLDENSPVIGGRPLRNHLAHNNALIDAVFNDLPLSVIINIQILIGKKKMCENKLKGKMFKGKPLRNREKFAQDLRLIDTQKVMFTAINNGNLHDLKHFIERGADIYGRDIHLSTAVHFAAKSSNVEMLKFFLEQHFKFNVKDYNGWNPLHMAASFDRSDIAKYIINNKLLNIDDADNERVTPLHIAAMKGHENTLLVLLESDAKITVSDINFMNPVHYAIEHGHIVVTKHLLSRNPNIYMGDFTALHVAAEYGHLEIIQFLLLKNTNIHAKTDRNLTPLHLAAQNGHVEIVKILLVKGADVNARSVDGRSPMHFAIDNDHYQVVTFLLKFEPNINVTDNLGMNTPLHYASRRNRGDIVKILVQNKANVNITNIDGMTPLHFAVYNSNKSIVLDLIECGANINARNICSYMPLHIALQIGQVNIAKMLICRGALVNVATSCGTTPLHLAALKGNRHITDLLIQNGAMVEAKDVAGNTPLHMAALNGNISILETLIQNKSDVNAYNNDDSTPLFQAILNGGQVASEYLIKNKANICIRNKDGITPLATAIMGGHVDIVAVLIQDKQILCFENSSVETPLHLTMINGNKHMVELLLRNGANVNTTNKYGMTVLCYAVKYNRKDIIKFLIKNGADVHAKNSQALFLAISSGFKNIVELLLQNNANVDAEGAGRTPLYTAVVNRQKDIVHILIKRGANINVSDCAGRTPLHAAIEQNYKDIVNILIKSGADVNAVTITGHTPLILAVRSDNEILKSLLSKGAEVNATDIDGQSALHLAVSKSGNEKIVKTLLEYGSNFRLKDKENRLPIELAVAYNCLEIVKLLHSKHDSYEINMKGNDDYTLLHIAAEKGNTQIVQFLIDKGADVNSRKDSSLKPIHLSAREGFMDTTEVLLKNGSHVNDSTIDNQTVLHYATLNGKLVDFLIKCGANVNARDSNDLTPLHYAALFCRSKSIIEIFLANGAMFNATDKLNRTPLMITKDKDIIDILTLIEKLFKFVKRNDLNGVRDLINAGTFLNAKDFTSNTALHYAAWKGYSDVTNILLQSKAHPNIANNSGFTPLHYAAKFSHFQVAKLLLSCGAMFNIISENGKTPMDMTNNGDTRKLLEQVTKVFNYIENKNTRVIYELNKIKNIDLLKVIMNARDIKNESVIVSAINNNFPKIDLLKNIFECDDLYDLNQASKLLRQGKTQEALCVLYPILDKRKQLLGPDNPSTLDIQENIAKILYEQGLYHESLKLFEAIIIELKKMFGENDVVTLRTKSFSALILHRLERNDEALVIFQEVYPKQEQIFGSNHLDTLATKFHMALVLTRLGKLQESLKINQSLYDTRVVLFGINDPDTVVVKNNIADVLQKQGKYEEALKIFNEIHQQKIRLFGINSSVTLNTKCSIAANHCAQKNYHIGINIYEEILDVLKKMLPPNQPFILRVKLAMAIAFDEQGMVVNAYEFYREIIGQRKYLGETDPIILFSLQRIESMKNIFKLNGQSRVLEICEDFQRNITKAAHEGDVEAMKEILQYGGKINCRDSDERTPLHHAASNGHLAVVLLLLKNGADPKCITARSNTALHLAVLKGHTNIVQALLKHIKDELRNFVNAVTCNSGSTALHIAAKGGFLKIVQTLLSSGAIYNIQNKLGQTPSDVCKEQNVEKLLKSIEQFFGTATNGDTETLRKLESLGTDDLDAVLGAINNKGFTLLQVAILNKYMHFSKQLLEMIKNLRS